MEHELLNFVRHLSARGRARNTIAAYRGDLSLLAEYLRSQSSGGELSWSDVTSEMLLAYRDHITEQGLARTTTARKMAAMHSFFRFLKASGIRSDDPSQAIRAPAVNRVQPAPLDRGDIERLRQASGPTTTPKTLRDRAMLELLCMTGISASELSRLRLGDVDLERAALRIGLEGHLVREVPIRQDSLHRLKAYLEHGRPRLVKNPAETTLFLNHRGQPLTRQGIWLIIKDYARQHGLSTITPSALRRTWLFFSRLEGEYR